MTYEWLNKETGPKVLIEALKLIGTTEVTGEADNPIILQWAKDIGVASYYIDDSIPWCGLFVAVVVKRAGKMIVKNPLRAKSWVEFGTEQTIAMLGDVLVFSRDGGGHVGFYIGEDADCYHVLGGNQGDMVKIARIKKDRCIAIRRSTWSIKQPDNVRVIQLSATGTVSQNEA